MTLSRNKFSSLMGALAATATLIFSGAASANSYQHPTNDETGVITHPDHFKSSKTRAEVRAEAISAMRQQGVAFFNKYPPPVQMSGPGKTRKEVRDEYLNEPPAERAERLRLLGGG